MIDESGESSLDCVAPVAERLIVNLKVLGSNPSVVVWFRISIQKIHSGNLAKFGLRRQTQVLFSKEAWVQIPQLPPSLYGVVDLSLTSSKGMTLVRFQVWAMLA